MPSPLHPTRTYDRRVPPSQVINVPVPVTAYTQSFTATLFGGAIVTGIGTQVVTDDFNRANQNPIAGNWTIDSGQANHHIIASNLVDEDASTGSDIYTIWNAWASGNDQYSQAEATVVGTLNGNGPGVMVRHSPTATVITCYRLVIDDTGYIELARFNTGTFTFLASRAVSYAAGKKLGLAIQGSTLSIWYNGVKQGADIVDASPITSGVPGIAHSAPIATSRLDNWDAGTTGGGGGPSATLTRKTGKAVAAVISWIGNLATSFTHPGGTAFTQSVTGALSFIGSRATRSIKSLTATLWISQPTFPIRPSSNNRYLVGNNGAPFLAIGDAPHSILVNLTNAEVTTYMTQRGAAGFNILWIELLCNSYTFGYQAEGITNYGKNLNNDNPFTGILAGGGGYYDLTTPNSAYWSHVDFVVQQAAANGLICFLTPLDQGGWSNTSVENGTTRCQQYGQFLGNRYKDYPNIFWNLGNDFQAWSDPTYEGPIIAIMDGIRSTDSNHPITIQLSYPVSNSQDDTNFISRINVNGVYTYQTTYVETLVAYNKATVMPVLFLEEHYEEEALFGETGTPDILRRQEYWSLVSGALAGHLYGSFYTDRFDPAWPTHLDTQCTRELMYFKNFFTSRRWYNLVPDQSHTMLTAGYGTVGDTSHVGNNDAAMGALTSDGGLGVVYTPVTHTLTIDLSVFSGAITARWYDPSTANTFNSISGSPFSNTGTHNFTSPGTNSAGDTDWVLVLEVGNQAVVTGGQGNWTTLNLKTTKSLSAILAFVGLLKKRISRLLAAGLSYIGNLATNLIHAGGTLFTQSVSGTVSFVGSQVKQARKAIRGILYFGTPVVVSDNFNRANGALGSNWTSPVGNFGTGLTGAEGTLQIAGNQVGAVTDDTHCFALWNGAFIDNQYAQIKCTLVGPWTGMILRAEYGIDRYYLGFVFGANDYRLHRRWDGVFEQLAIGTTETWVNNDICRIEVSGSGPVSMRMYRNGVQVLSWVSPNASYVKTGGNPGMGIYSRAGDNLRLDDWEGGGYVAAPGTVGTPIASDNFDRANGAIGSNWTHTTTSGSTFVIVGNRAGVAAENVHCAAFWNANSFADNQYGQFRYLVNASYSGVVLRADAVLDRYYLGLIQSNTHATLYARWDGTYVQLVDVTSLVGLSIGDTIRMEVIGNVHPITITMYQNGYAILTWTSPDSTNVRAGGSPGIGIFSPTAANIVLDDWEGGNLVAGTAPVLDNIFIKKTNRTLAAILSFIGSSLKSGKRLLSASLPFIGSLTKLTRRTLIASLSFIGTWIKKFPKILTSTLSFVGSISKRGRKALSGILPFVDVGGTTWASNGTPSSIQNLHDNFAQDGDTITLPAGTFAWTSGIDLTKEVTLKGAGTSVTGGGDQTVITDNLASGNALISLDSSLGNTSRMTGITVQSGSGSIKDGGTVTIGGDGKIRIDHCHFISTSAANYKTIQVGCFGIIDHCILDLTSTNAIFLYNGRLGGGGDQQGNLEWTLPTNFGSDEYFYIEDNIINGTAGGTVYDTRIFDGFTAAKVVVRFNTVSQAVLGETHATGHAPDDRGLRSQEIYGNLVTSSLVHDPNFCAVDMGNGTTLLWGNSWDQVYKNIYLLKQTRKNNDTYGQTATPSGWGYAGTEFNGTGSNWDGGTALTTDTLKGYPVLDQVGRGPGDLITGVFPTKINSTTGTIFWPHQALEPVYIWNNTGALVSGWGGSTYDDDTGGRVVSDRDYYKPASGIQVSASSPFNGTTGCGWGTLANRPTTCTTGVGYFAIDQGSWNKSTSNPYGVQQSGASGVLYKATATNTWTPYYTPYIYPHPLQTQSVISGAVLIKKTFRLLAAISSFVGNLATQLSHVGAYTLTVTANLPFVGTIKKSTKHVLSGILSFVGSLPRRARKVISGVLPFSDESTGGAIWASDGTPSSIQNLHDSFAVDGDTITIPAGSFTWFTTVEISKGITLQGAGLSSSHITDNSSAGPPLVVTCTAAHFVRVTGLEFIKGIANTFELVSFGGDISGGNNETGFRFDHCKLNFPIVTGRGVYVRGIFGVIDHNNVVVSAAGSQQCISIDGSPIGSDGGFTPWTRPLTLGTDKAVYVEDNTFDYTGNDQSEDSIDGYSGMRIVVRHNTFLSISQGFHGTDSGGARSPHTFEVYNNTYINNSVHQIRALTVRGGTGVVWGNTYGGSMAWYGITLQYFRATSGAFTWQKCDGTVWQLGSTDVSTDASRTCSLTGGVGFNSIDKETLGTFGGAYTRGFDGTGLHGYPGRDQPGFSTGQVLTPIYIWDQSPDLSAGTFAGGDPTDEALLATFIVEGREWYNNTPRPGYTPYTYPHPLVTESVSSGVLLKKTFRLLAAISSFVGSLKGRGGKILAGAVSFAGAITRKTTRLFASVLSFVGNFQSLLSHAGTNLLNIASNLSFVGSLPRSTRRSVSSVLSFLGLTGRGRSKILSAAISFTGNTLKRFPRALAASIAFIGNLTFIRAITKALVASLAFIGTLGTAQAISRLFTAAVTFTGTIARRIPKSISGLLSFIGDLAGNVPSTLQKTFTATLSLTGYFFQRAGKVLRIVVSLTQSLAKVIKINTRK